MILDINDNAPLFPVLSTAVEVSESAEPGTSFIIPAAEDLDSPKYSVRNHSISPPTSHFSLSVRVVTPPAGTGSGEVGDDVGTAPPTQIRLVLREQLDRESAEHFRLFVVATDAGHPVQPGALVVDRSLPVVRRGDGCRTSGQVRYTRRQRHRHRRQRQRSAIRSTRKRKRGHFRSGRDPTSGVGVGRHHRVPDARRGRRYRRLRTSQVVLLLPPPRRLCFHVVRLFVCLLEGLRKNYSSDFHKIRWIGGM